MSRAKRFIDAVRSRRRQERNDTRYISANVDGTDYEVRVLESTRWSMVVFQKNRWSPQWGPYFWPPGHFRNSEGRYVSKSLQDVLRNVLKQAAKEEGLIQAKDAEFAADHPVLHDLMTIRVGPDKKPRQVCSLTIFTDDGMFKACLSERDHNLSLWASGDALSIVLMNLEEMLQSEVVPWRRKPLGTPKKKS